MMDTRDAANRPRDEGRIIPSVKRRGERLVGLLIAGVVLLNFPFLSVFSTNRPIFGIPILYLYLFSVWVLIISVMALILRNRRADPTVDNPEIKE